MKMKMKMTLPTANVQYNKNNLNATLISLISETKLVDFALIVSQPFSIYFDEVRFVYACASGNVPFFAFLIARICHFIHFREAKRAYAKAKFSSS